MSRKIRGRPPDVVEYRSSGVSRASAGDVPVFCAFDELVSPLELIGNPRNPNRHPAEQIKLLARIIQSQGWRAPITVSNRSGFVVRGHGRVAAALEFGAELVPVERQNYGSEAEEWADLIADNRLAELAEMDDELLTELIAEMDTGEVPLILSGYTEDDIANILAAIAGEDDGETDGVDNAPDVPEITMSKPGDLWILPTLSGGGEHRVLCGSATDPATVERLMDGNKASLVFTDPPYGVSYISQSGKFDMLQNDDKTGDDLYATLLIPAFKNMKEHTTDAAAFYIWHASSSRRDFEDAMTAVGLIEKQYIIWVKNNFQLGHADYHWGHEPCFYAEKVGQSAAFYGDRTNQTVWRAALHTGNSVATTITGGIVITDGAGGKIYICEQPPKGKKTRYIRIGDKDSAYLCGKSKSSTAWEIARDTGIEHPTQKPVELATRAIENSTQEGEIVLDLFGGSGTTLIGAQLLGRRAYLTELDPRYVDVIVNRCVRITGNTLVTCVRGGKQIPYIQLKAANDAANNRGQEER